MRTIAARLAEQYPKSNTNRSERVFSLHSDMIALSGAALLATYFPARRAMNVDPMEALRSE